MSGLLSKGDRVRCEHSGDPCVIRELLGDGTQGEVYKAELKGQEVAVKWYFPSWLKLDQRQRERLQDAIEIGSPTDRFLWPIDLVVAGKKNSESFGYVMPLRDSKYVDLVALMRRRAEPSFRSLARAGYELATSYRQLHLKGLCYRDISFGNAFLDPSNGEVLICDNDNVDYDGRPGPVSGTPRFMAPEIVTGKSQPNAKTDLYSLAVLLFYMFTLSHPLEGKQEADIHALDGPAMVELYGKRAVFIFDPLDKRNVPDPVLHRNAIVYWNVYPKSVRDMFIRAFVDGIRDPDHGRVAEIEWAQVMVRLRDSIFYCGCGKENFYDRTRLSSDGRLYSGKCWSCQKPLVLPPRLRIDDFLIMLTHDAKVYPYHVAGRSIEPQNAFDKAVGKMVKHPTVHDRWGLQNDSSAEWVAMMPDGRSVGVAPGRTVDLVGGMRVLFGSAEGQVRA